MLAEHWAGQVSAISEPVPARLIVWGVPGASSEIDSAAVNKPAFTGSNVTGIVQLAPAARLAPQLMTPVLKFSPPGPVIEIPLILRASRPVFVNVTFCAGLPEPTPCSE